MQSIPLYIGLSFGLITGLFVYAFYRAAHRSQIFLLIVCAWLALQAGLGFSGFYTVTTGMPPRFLLLIGPPVLTILVLFLTRRGRRFIRGLDPALLTLMHTLRIPVELILLGLYIHGAVPELMTFEGRNFDILSGLSAPLIWYFGYLRKRLHRYILLLWNLLALGLLLNIVIHAILSAPTPFQQFAFDQPNIALLHVPFLWLPCCVVPLVLLAHLAVLMDKRPMT